MTSPTPVMTIPYLHMGSDTFRGALTRKCQPQARVANATDHGIASQLGKSFARIGVSAPPKHFVLKWNSKVSPQRLTRGNWRAESKLLTACPFRPHLLTGHLGSLPNWHPPTKSLRFWLLASCRGKID